MCSSDLIPSWTRRRLRRDTGRAMSQRTVQSVRGVRTAVAVSEQHGDRTLDEQILLRFPRLVRLALSLWSRLPPRSRLRRIWLARNIRRGCAAGNRRDFDLLLLSFDPDIEYESVVGDSSGALFPDMVGLRRGHAAYRGIWEALDEAWDDVKLEHHEVIDFGDRVVALGRVVGRARHTGIPVDQPICQVFMLRRGVIVRQQDFPERDQALDAVGLRE